MKPNGEELASFTGHPAEELEADPSAAADAAYDLLQRGVESVLVTLGPHGAVLVGAGDSSLFGYLYGDVTGRDPAQRLALAVAYGSAAAGLPGTTIPHPRQARPDLGHVARLTPPTEG
jgi:1-phosphofructokinase